MFEDLMAVGVFNHGGCYFTWEIHGISNVGSLGILGIFRSQIIVYLSNEL